MFSVCSLSYAGTNYMSVKTGYLCLSVFVMLLTAVSVKGQTGSPEFSDTSQPITKEELIRERAVMKVRLDRAKNAKKVARSDAKVTRLKKQSVRNSSFESKRPTGKRK
jgi:hypothetical protein